MERGKILTVLFLSLLLLAFSFELSYAYTTVEIDTANNKISLGETALFNLMIRNTGETKQTYTIYSTDLGWNVDPQPLTDRVLILDPGESKSTKITITPTEDFSPGVYNIKLRVDSEKGNRVIKDISILIKPSQPVEYTPSLKVDVDIPTKVDPGSLVPIRLDVKNLIPRDLNNITVTIESDIDELNKVIEIGNLPSLNTKTIDLSAKIDQFQQPKDYTVFISFEYKGESIKVERRNIEVSPILSKFDTGEKVVSRFLKTERTISISNSGNTKNTQEVLFRTSRLRSFFTTPLPSAELINKGDALYWKWSMELSPSETTDAVLVENYRVPFYILIILLLLFVVYMSLRNPISIRKSAASLIMAEGGVEGVKIILRIKNTSKKTIKDINVVDILPSIINIDKDVETGTIPPSKVMHSIRGTLIQWNIPEIEGKEERLITYRTKAKLRVLGEMKLPRAKVNFKDNKGKKKTTYSNTFSVVPS